MTTSQSGHFCCNKFTMARQGVSQGCGNSAAIAALHQITSNDANRPPSHRRWRLIPKPSNTTKKTAGPISCLGAKIDNELERETRNATIGPESANNAREK